MKTLKIILMLFVISTYSELAAQNQPLFGNNSALGLKLNKSLTVASGEYDYIEIGNPNRYRSTELVNSTFGLGLDFLYKASSERYLNISLMYSFYSLSDKIKFENEKNLEATSIDFTVNGNLYLNDPKYFTPYIGGGGGFVFLYSNEVDLVKSGQDENFIDSEVDYFSELNLFFNLKIGLHIPLNEQLFVYPEFDFMMITAENLGVIPKISVGASYWLE